MNNLFSQWLAICCFLIVPQFIEAQKVTLTFTQPLSSTPSVSKASLRYNKDFAYSFTFDDADNDPFTVGLPLFKGGAVPNSGFTSNGFFYTDGCGNQIPFRAGIAWNTANTLGQDVHQGNVAGKMTWAQLDQLYTEGWDVLNHSWSHRSRWEGTMSDADYTYQINQNPIEVLAKTANHIKTPLFIVPSGDYFYQDRALAQGAKAVFDQNFPNGGVSFNGIAVDGALNFQNFKAHRQELDQVIVGATPNKLNPIAQLSQNGTHYWYNEFTHRIDNFDQSAAFNFYKVRDYFANIATTYGASGSDRIWMASLSEVFEYLVVRDHLSFTANVVNGNQLDINFNLSQLPTWLPRRKCITLIINSNLDFSNVQLPNGVTGTWRGTGGVKLLNLDFANYSGAIPVELAQFSGIAKDKKAELTWQTVAEIRFAGFDLEKSTDGQNFRTLANMKAKGAGSNYHFTDEILEEIAHYRLKIKNLDGSFDYSKVVILTNNDAKKLVKITPSVSDGFLTVETNLESRNASATLEIFDTSGHLHWTQKTAKDVTLVNINALPTNFYLLRVTIGGSVWVHKFTKL
jgi:hypothetical protein